MHTGPVGAYITTGINTPVIRIKSAFEANYGITGNQENDIVSATYIEGGHTPRS